MNINKLKNENGTSTQKKEIGRTKTLENKQINYRVMQTYHETRPKLTQPAVNDGFKNPTFFYFFFICSHH